MSELQPGMLALVIGCRVDPVLIGSLVTLIKMVEPGESFNGMTFIGTENCWMVEGDSLASIKADGSHLIANHSYVAPRHLLPIKPESDPLDVTHKEELHA
jgi:hypothetical protein